MARLTYEAVQKQIARLQAQAKALEAARDGRKAKAVERVRALMKKLGVEVSDLAAAPAAQRARKAGARKAAPRKVGKKTGATVPPKYRDPETGDTWTGRGRTPVWMTRRLEQGKSRDDFLIQAG